MIRYRTCPHSELDNILSMCELLVHMTDVKQYRLWCYKKCLFVVKEINKRQLSVAAPNVNCCPPPHQATSDWLYVLLPKSQLPFPRDTKNHPPFPYKLFSQVLLQRRIMNIYLGSRSDRFPSKPAISALYHCILGCHFRFFFQFICSCQLCLIFTRHWQHKGSVSTTLLSLSYSNSLLIPADY